MLKSECGCYWDKGGEKVFLVIFRIDLLFYNKPIASKCDQEFGSLCVLKI